MPELSPVVILTVREGTEGETRGVLAALVPPSRQDTGNLRYELYGDQAAPRRFAFVERWADEADQFKDDRQSTHIREFAKRHGD